MVARRGAEPIAVKDFLDEYDRTCATKNAPTVVVGPRTHGVTDPKWDDDVRKFRGRDAAIVLDTRIEERAATTPVMMALAAWNDPALPFRTDAENTVRSWVQGPLKQAYQAARVPRKRPWPEFAASLRAGFGFTVADAAAIALAAHVNIASLDNNKGLIVGPRSLDAEFTSLVLDVQAASPVSLGRMCERAVGRCGQANAALLDTAQALAMNTNGLGRRALEASVAARIAALDTWSRDQNGSDTMS